MGRADDAGGGGLGDVRLEQVRGTQRTGKKKKYNIVKADREV